MDLSTRRARRVVASLVTDYGIDPARLEPSGRGLTQPIASNDTDQGRAQNRRMELVALSGPGDTRTVAAAVETTIYDKPAGTEIAYLRKGDRVTVISRNDIGWCQINGPKQGYVWGPDLSK